MGNRGKREKGKIGLICLAKEELFDDLFVR